MLIIRCGLLAEIKPSVCMSKSQMSLLVPFSRTDAGLWRIYRLFVWSNLNFLYISQLIILPTTSCLILYSFCANLLHSLIMWLMVSHLLPHSLHLLFCCVLSIICLCFRLSFPWIFNSLLEFWSYFYTVPQIPISFLGKKRFWISKKLLWLFSTEIYSKMICVSLNKVTHGRIILKSDFLDRIKRAFFQIVDIAVLLYDCSTLTLNETLGEKAIWKLHKDAACLFWANPGSSTREN